MTLTIKEREVMLAIFNSEYSDGSIDCCPWSWSVTDGSRSRAGVLSSLCKKGMISVWNHGEGSARDQVCAFTDEGKRFMKGILAEEAKASDTNAQAPDHGAKGGEVSCSDCGDSGIVVVWDGGLPEERRVYTCRECQSADRGAKGGSASSPSVDGGKVPHVTSNAVAENPAGASYLSPGVLRYATEPTRIDPEPKGKLGFVSLARAVQFVVWVRRHYTNDCWVNAQTYTVHSRNHYLWEELAKFQETFGKYGEDPATTEEAGARVLTRGPWAQLHSFPHCLCPDGKRRLATVTGEADTFFSVPARVTVKGRTVTGFVMARELADGSEDWAFYPNKSGKNAAVFEKEAFESTTAESGRKGGEASSPMLLAHVPGITVGEIADAWANHPRLTNEQAMELAQGDTVYTQWGPYHVAKVKRVHDGRPSYGGIPEVVVYTPEGLSHLPGNLSLFPLLAPDPGAQESGAKGGSAGSAVAPARDAGIDYGMGHANVDRETGIRYGVIAQNSLCQESLHESLEPDYGDATCPACGGEVIDSSEVKHWELWRKRMEAKGQHGCFDYACLSCRMGYDSGECFPEEALSWELEVGGEYDAHGAFDNTCLFVTRSPYYTHAVFCSPCAPGAGDLDSPAEGGVRTFCLGHDWFDGGVAPYPVYRVSDDSRVPSRLESWRVEYRFKDGRFADEWFDMGTTFDSADHAQEAAAEYNERWAFREHRAVAPIPADPAQLALAL